MRHKMDQKHGQRVIHVCCCSIMSFDSTFSLAYYPVLYRCGVTNRKVPNL
uniref:DUF2946 domain-containing protein n=1 Tax=Heterorhabditis bacteriophora TaxID=37862 RepID=A0A1I7XPB2_HETBA